MIETVLSSERGVVLKKNWPSLRAFGMGCSRTGSRGRAAL